MEFVKSVIKDYPGLLRFRYSEPRYVPTEETPGSSMSRRVFLAEAEDIRASREKRVTPTAPAFDNCLKALKAWEASRDGAQLCNAEAGAEEVNRDDWTPPVEADLVGLALSGGGIRSATFSLGALQVLGERGVLRHVDYLSTVSGGGYIGSFWTCFLARSRIDGNRLADVVEDGARPFQRNPLYMLQHIKGREEGEAFRRLRNYANYLLLGGLWDRLRGPALMIRGLFINFLMVLPYVLLASGVVALLFHNQIKTGSYGWNVLTGIDVPLWGWALGIGFCFTVILSTVMQSIERRGGRANAHSRSALFRLNMGVALVALAVIWVDVQPKLIHALFDQPLNSVNGPSSASLTWGFFVHGEFWSALSAALGTISAIVGALTASRSTGLKAKLALAAVGIMVPLSFLFLYFLLTAWAVFGPPAWIGLPSWEVLLGWMNLRDLTGQSDWLSPERLTELMYVVVAAVLLLVSVLFFDVNATSLHNLYRDSLSRTFLFSLQKNKKIEIFDDEDNLQLGDVDIGKSGGPYHLLNATVNNPDLEDVALRGRRSDFFVFGPRYSGSNRFGYCPTSRLEDADPGANLGTALAVSAAAVAPNMGEKTKPLLRFLLAMLNLRLGYWSPSPQGALAVTNVWLNRVGPIHFLAELLGVVSKGNNQKFINLSDGGHIENLGIFELLRRRCKYIIAIDSEADPNMTFNGLATIIRLARTDMGVDIDIDVDNLRRDERGLSRRHWALGRINYGDMQTGELLYIKSSLTGSENEYITEYRSRNSDFPHETTADQFFDEVQFEAYRALGFKVGGSVFPSAAELKACPDEIFAKLRGRDTGAVHRNEAHFELLDRRRSIDRLLADPVLALYAREIVPEPETTDAPLPEQGIGAEISELPPFKLHQVCNEQLQLMERALLALRLDDPRNRRRRENRGWMNLFRRWGQSRTFQKMWAANIANYGSALQDFCQEELGLSLRVEWRLEPPQDDQEGRPGHYIATVCAVHPDGQKGPKFRVASATIQKRNGRMILVGFELRVPYIGVGLRERLFRAWTNHDVWQGDPTFDPCSAAIHDKDATVRALLRSHFHPDAEADSLRH